MGSQHHDDNCHHTCNDGGKPPEDVEKKRERERELIMMKVISFQSMKMMMMMAMATITMTMSTIITIIYAAYLNFGICCHCSLRSEGQLARLTTVMGRPHKGRPVHMELIPALTNTPVSSSVFISRDKYDKPKDTLYSH